MSFAKCWPFCLGFNTLKGEFKAVISPLSTECRFFGPIESILVQVLWIEEQYVFTGAPNEENNLTCIQFDILQET